MHRRAHIHRAEKSFNLSILECKYGYDTAVQMTDDGFNLSILECKFFAFVR